MTTTVNNSAASNNVVATIKAYDFGRIRQDYKSSKTFIDKMNKNNEKIAALLEENNKLQTVIDSRGSYAKMIVGMDMMSLVKVVTEDAVDKKGKAVKVSKFLPADNVVWNEDKKIYEVFGEQLMDAETSVDTDAVAQAVAEAEIPMTKVENSEENTEAEPADNEESNEAAPADAFGEPKDYQAAEKVNWDNL